MPQSYPQHERRRRLSPAALAVANEKVSASYSSVVISGIVRAFDLCSIAFVGLALHLMHVAVGGELGWIYLFLSGGIAGASVLAFQAASAYDLQAFRRLSDGIVRVVPAWCVLFLVLFAASLVLEGGDESTRPWLWAYFIGGIGVLIAGRIALQRLVKRWAVDGRLERRTVVVGADENGEKLVKMLQEQPDTDIRVLGVFDDRNDERALASCAGAPKLGKVADIVEFARRTRVDLVLFALPISAETRILQMLKQLWVLPVDIRLAAHVNALRFRPRSYAYLGNVPTLYVGEQPIRDWNLVLKWLFDHVVGGALLLLLSPLLLLIALAIKLDSTGPVLFKQKRFGFNNERVDVYKFRSLYVDQADPLAAKVVTKGDPRVTRVGRFIRRTSLDELPQLFNVVFAGNLSLVGPRPHAVYQKLENRMLDETVDGYFARHRVKPGMTGWAQINGWRGELDSADKIQKRVAFDLDYIENWSILFDLYILAKTPLALFKTENAY